MKRLIAPLLGLAMFAQPAHAFAGAGNFTLVNRTGANIGSMQIRRVGTAAWQPLGGNPGAGSRVAVAFTDLEGFTSYTANEGDDAASHLLADHHRQVGPIVRSRGGKIVKRLGDGLLLTFPEPEAAVLACLELVGTSPDPLRLRAGVHVGEVAVIPSDVIGHVVNIAARVAEAAKGGEVLVTGDVKDDVADDLPHLKFSRARRRKFKGLGESIPVCRVTEA